MVKAKKEKAEKESPADQLVDDREPIDVIADLEKRFSTRHAFSDADVIAVRADLDRLKEFF